MPKKSSLFSVMPLLPEKFIKNIILLRKNSKTNHGFNELHRFCFFCYTCSHAHISIIGDLSISYSIENWISGLGLG